MTRIEVTNKFTGTKTIHEVSSDCAWAALNHYRKAWNVARARFV